MFHAGKSGDQRLDAAPGGGPGDGCPLAPGLVTVSPRGPRQWSHPGDWRPRGWTRWLVPGRPGWRTRRQPIWRPGRTRRLAVFLLCSLVITPALAGNFKGQVVKVLDGDTIEVLGPAKRTQRVRLQGIDAPENSQPFGPQARQRLLALVGGKVVTVTTDKRDRHGRTLGKVSLAGQDVGLTLVREGYAWWYRDYAADQDLLDRVLYPLAEVQARWGDLGLWRDPDPIPPWTFRRR